MPMPASASSELAISPPVPPTKPRASMPAAASAIASKTVRSSPSRWAIGGVATPNTANARVGSMPSTPAAVDPNASDAPTVSSNGVSEVIAVRRLKAASAMPASTSSRPRQGWGDAMRARLPGGVVCRPVDPDLGDSSPLHVSRKTQMATQTAPQTETRPFEAEVAQVLHLVTHSLYSHKEIFLRELISNASDACDKLRFESLATPELMSGDGELHIDVSWDEKARTITIADNGIGMNRHEVVANIGTIASSGTRRYLAAMAQDKTADPPRIGPLGGGLYSG